MNVHEKNVVGTGDTLTCRNTIRMQKCYSLLNLFGSLNGCESCEQKLFASLVQLQMPAVSDLLVSVGAVHSFFWTSVYTYTGGQPRISFASTD